MRRSVTIDSLQTKLSPSFAPLDSPREACGALIICNFTLNKADKSFFILNI